MKKDLRANDEVEQSMKSIFDIFVKKEMSKAEFLHVVGGQDGIPKTLNIGGMWVIKFLGVRESTDEENYDFAVALQCPNCESPMTYHPKLWGNGAWFCGPCDTGVGCFKGTAIPAGFPTSSKGRKLRAETKNLVNEMVEKAKAGRFDAFGYVYAWMAKKLGYNINEVFITLASVSESELKLLQQYVSEWLRSDNPSKIDDLFKVK